MGVRESLLNTITSVADSDFVRIVTSAGASSKATVRNLFKGFESNLSAKSSLTTSDYIRVVGSDNEAYKQSVSNVKSVMGVDTLSSNLTSLSNALQGFKTYNDALTVDWNDCSYSGIGTNIKDIVSPGPTYRNKWVSLRVNNTGSSVAPFGASSFGVLFNCSSQNYGWAILMSDSTNTSFVVGRLSVGSWTWGNIWSDVYNQKLVRKIKNYSTITIPSSGYVKVDSFSGLGVSSDYYLVNAMVRGWSGATPYGIDKGSNGTDIYLVGAPGTVSNFSIEYFFVRSVEQL